MSRQSLSRVLASLCIALAVGGCSSDGQPGTLSAADQQLKAQMGELNFAAGEELVRCRHVSAISRAEKADSGLPPLCA